MVRMVRMESVEVEKMRRAGKGREVEKMRRAGKSPCGRQKRRGSFAALAESRNIRALC